MAEWKVGKSWSYEECPVTAKSTYGGEEIEVGVAEEHLTVETQVGYGGGYNGCNHSVEPRIPMSVLIELLRAHGYEVKKT